MNTYQQTQATKSYSQEKDDVTTQAETFISLENQTLTEKIVERLPIFGQEINRQHEVCSKISQGTFSSDKMLRMISSILKVVRCYNMVNNLKTVERLSAQIGQLRRLLRYDRITLIIKEYLGFCQKGRLTKVEKALVILKILIVIGDINDILAFFVQLRILKNDSLLGSLRRNVADIYFFECIGWLLYHIYEYCRSKDQESAEKNKMMVIKYIMDSLTSHNDFSKRLFTMDPKLASLIGAVSSIMNLYLIWK